MSPAFERLNRKIEAASDRHHGESFDWLGESYLGVPAEAGIDMSMMAMGGKNSSADFVLTCARDQFVALPTEGESITWRDGAWKIMEVKSPGDLFSVILHVKKRVK